MTSKRVESAFFDALDFGEDDEEAEMDEQITAMIKDAKHLLKTTDLNAMLVPAAAREAMPPVRASKLFQSSPSKGHPYQSTGYDAYNARVQGEYQTIKQQTELRTALEWRPRLQAALEGNDPTRKQNLDQSADSDGLTPAKEPSVQEFVPKRALTKASQGRMLSKATKAVIVDPASGSEQSKQRVKLRTQLGKAIQSQQDEFVISSQASGKRMAWIAQLLFRDNTPAKNRAPEIKLTQAEEVRLQHILDKR